MTIKKFWLLPTATQTCKKSPWLNLILPLGGIGSSSIVLDLPKAPNNQAVVLQQLRGHGTDLFVAVNHPDGKGLLKKYRLEEYSFLGFRLSVESLPNGGDYESLNDAAVETLTHLEVNETYAVTGAFVANGAVQLRAFDHSLNLLDAEKIFAADGENVTDLQGLAFQPDSNRLYLLHGRNNRTEMFGAELGISAPCSPTPLCWAVLPFRCRRRALPITNRPRTCVTSCTKAG